MDVCVLRGSAIKCVIKIDMPCEWSQVISAGKIYSPFCSLGNLALSRALGDFIFKKNDRKPVEEQIVTGKSRQTTLHTAVLLVCSIVNETQDARVYALNFTSIVKVEWSFQHIRMWRWIAWRKIPNSWCWHVMGFGTCWPIKRSSTSSAPASPKSAHRKWLVNMPFAYYM